MFIPNLLMEKRFVTAPNLDSDSDDGDQEMEKTDAKRRGLARIFFPSNFLIPKR